MIINHTDCGMLTFKDEEAREMLQQRTGASPEAPAHFHAFTDPEINVRQQVQKVKAHPWIPQDLTVRGFVYDVKTGGLREVAAEARAVR